MFLVYDISERSSFDAVPNWIKFINDYEHTTIVILANKSDLNDKRKVTTEEGENYAKENNFEFHEISAKNDNLQSVLYSSIAALPALQSIASERSTKEEIINDLVLENEDGPEQGAKTQEEGFQRDAKAVINTVDEDKNDALNAPQPKKKKCPC